MAPQLNQYNVILLEAASDEENPDDISWPMLRTYLRGAKVDTSERTEGEWLRSFQNFRRIIREDNERTSEDQSPSAGLETKSDGASTSDSGYISGDHSESAKDKVCGVLISKNDAIQVTNPVHLQNDEQHLLHLVVKSGLYPGDETAPVGYRYTDALEGNYIRQTIYERFQLQKDSDGMLNLTFFNKERSRTIVKRCRVVPDDQGIADVVFGKEPPKPSKTTEDGGDKSQHKGITPYYLRPHLD